VKTAKKYNKTFQILWYHQHEYFSSTESLSYCSYGNCVMTNKKSVLETSDAVLFAYDPMNTDKPRKRSGQIWIIAHVNETMIALFFIDILTETKGYYLKCDFTKQTIKYYEKNI
jgi:hypothetical protein